jgi:hypothetical protein
MKKGCPFISGLVQRTLEVGLFSIYPSRIPSPRAINLRSRKKCQAPFSNDLRLRTRSLIHTTFVLTSKPNKKLIRLPCTESRQWNLSLIANSCSDMIFSTYSNRWNLLSAGTTLLRLYPNADCQPFRSSLFDVIIHDRCERRNMFTMRSMHHIIPSI